MRLHEILKENDNALAVLRQSGLSALPDNAQWTHRFEIHSASSSRVYIIAKRKSDSTWACSCMGWKRFRHCKHLDAVRGVTTKIDQIDGLGASIAKAQSPTDGAGVSTSVKRSPKSDEAIAAAKERSRRSFSNDAYKHHDGPFGTKKQWEQLANDKLSSLGEKPGDRERFSDGKHTSKRERLMHVIGAQTLPKTLAELKSVARKKLMATHPDLTGSSDSADEFRKVYSAYEDLALDLFNVKI